jgi:hypothetical protein
MIDELMNIDAAVMLKLRAPFGCEFIPPPEHEGLARGHGRWRIHDANDDAIASVSHREEGYARLIVQALNELFERRAKQ